MYKILFISFFIIVTYSFLLFYSYQDKIDKILIEMSNKVDEHILEKIERCLMLDNQIILEYHAKEYSMMYVSKYSLIKFQAISYLYSNLLFDRRSKNTILWIIEKKSWFFFSYFTLNHKESLMIHFYYFPWCQYRGNIL